VQRHGRALRSIDAPAFWLTASPSEGVPFAFVVEAAVQGRNRLRKRFRLARWTGAFGFERSFAVVSTGGKRPQASR
jgi:hypothetical protein